MVKNKKFDLSEKKKSKRETNFREAGTNSLIKIFFFLGGETTLLVSKIYTFCAVSP